MYEQDLQQWHARARVTHPSAARPESEGRKGFLSYSRCVQIGVGSQLGFDFAAAGMRWQTALTLFLHSTPILYWLGLILCSHLFSPYSWQLWHKGHGDPDCFHCRSGKKKKKGRRRQPNYYTLDQTVMSKDSSPVSHRRAVRNVHLKEEEPQGAGEWAVLGACGHSAQIQQDTDLQAYAIKLSSPGSLYNCNYIYLGSASQSPLFQPNSIDCWCFTIRHMRPLLLFSLGAVNVCSAILRKPLSPNDSKICNSFTSLTKTSALNMRMEVTLLDRV